MHHPRILLLCIIFRILNALCTGQSVFNPDEYWQSMEVAYRAVWSGGFLAWEYQSHAQLRGILHPAIFALLYAALKLLGWDSTWMVSTSPRLLQALFAGVGDYYLYLLASRLLGRVGARWTLFLSLTSWFFFYCLARTLSNSMECSLCMIAFYYWPDTSAQLYPSEQDLTAGQLYRRNRRKALIIAAIVFIIRPTNALIWLFLGSYHLVFVLPTWKSRLRLIFIDVLPIAILTLFVSVTLDTLFYHRHLFIHVTTVREFVAALLSIPLSSLPLVSLRFLRLNHGTDLSQLYGTHPWHWYFTQGLPTNLGALTLFVPWSIKRFIEVGNKHKIDDGGDPNLLSHASRRSLWLHLALMIWTLIAYSFNAHKEFRFILVVTHVPMLFVARSMAQMQNGEDSKQAVPEDQSRAAINSSTEYAYADATIAEYSAHGRAEGLRKRHQSSSSSSSSSTPRAIEGNKPTRWRVVLTRSRLMAFFLLLSNVAMGGYLTFVHQSGLSRVFNTLHDIVQERFSLASSAASSLSPTHHLSPIRIHFLLQCHSMPLYSFLHLRRQLHKDMKAGEDRDVAPPRLVDLHFLDCSPLFVNGSLFGSGANPCSASAHFASNPLQFVRQYYSTCRSDADEEENDSMRPTKRDMPSNRWVECEWPWYHSDSYRQCLTERVGLSDEQIAAINNEVPGGSWIAQSVENGIAANTSTLRCQPSPSSASSPPPLVRSPTLSDVLVTHDAVLDALQPFFHDHSYMHRASLFHSHFDDTKSYHVFERKK